MKLLILLVSTLVLAAQPNEMKVENRARRVLDGKVWHPSSSTFMTVYLRDPQQTSHGVVAIQRSYSVEKTGATITTQLSQTQARSEPETQVVWADGDRIVLLNCIMSDIRQDANARQLFVRAIPSEPVQIGDETFKAFDLGVPELASVSISSSRAPATNTIAVQPRIPVKASPGIDAVPKAKAAAQVVIQQPRDHRTPEMKAKYDALFVNPPKRIIEVDWAPRRRG